MTRTILGLSVGSGLEGVDAAVVRVQGVGLTLTARVERAVRFPFPPVVRDLIRPPTGGSPGAVRAAVAELSRKVADTASQAIRGATAHPDRVSRDVLAVGLLEPQRVCGSAVAPDWAEVADRLADGTGLTIAHAFRNRDRAGGGAGHPITPVADYLLFRDPAEDRLLVHLGAVATVVHLPAGTAKVSAVGGFDAGPCNHLLDAIITHGTRSRETSDPGGKRAVQGCAIEPLLERWREHPFFARKPPRAVGVDQFGASFVAGAFDAARGSNASLPDLLCTATHLIAGAVGDGVGKWLPAPLGPRRVVVSGGGVRNGFLWQLLTQRFDGQPLTRLDDVHVPALARNAAAAAVMAALLMDGVPGNLPTLTGATGSRLSGHLSPGDPLNWSRCAAWVAEQAGDGGRFSRAA